MAVQKKEGGASKAKPAEEKLEDRRHLKDEEFKEEMKLLDGSTK